MKKKLFTSKIWRRFKSEPFYPFEIVDDKNGPHEYKLLTKGELTPVPISAEEILSSNIIKRRLEPNVLLKIQRDLLYEQAKFKQYKITNELPRENRYRISTIEETMEIDGDDFCNNPYLITQMRSYDVFKITANTFFKKGAKFQETLSEVKLQQKEKNNKNKFVDLKIIK